MPPPRYQDFLDQLARGEYYGVFIDDSGSPGLQVGNGSLHPDRKTWAAVVVSPTQNATVLAEMPGVIRYLQAELGADELHFADIWNGRRQFKDVRLEVRLSLFAFMATVFQQHGFKVLVQTLDPGAARQLLSGHALPPLRGPLNPKKHDHLALLILLVRLRDFLRAGSDKLSHLARVFVDESILRAGGAIQFPVEWKPFSELLADRLLCFGSSRQLLPLQLADFAAFIVNRWQLLLQTKALSDADRKFVHIVGPVAANFVNLEQRTLRFDDWST